MKKSDPRLNDTRVIKGSGNVFDDLGFDKAEAQVMKLRTELMLKLEQRVREKGWTQTETAKRLHITQPRVSRLLNGAWQEFNMETLLTLAARAGLRPKVELQP